jgi:UDP-glucose 4-epimerase
VRQVDAVVHLAARFANQNSVDFPIDDLLTNAVGTLELLEAARGYPVRFVYASSSCVSQLKTPYAVSKLTGEQYVRFYGEQHGLPVNVVRYFNSYGPHDYPGVYRSVIPNWLAQAMRQEPLVIYGDGDDTRDFTFVEDIAEATVRLVAADSFGHVIEVGTGQMTTIARLARMINALVANRAGVVFHPRRSWDTVRHRCAQVETAAAVLQYVPATSLEVGLRATYAWLRTVPMAAVRG